MAGANASVKMGVTGISQFKADIRTAKDSMKTLETQLALTEKQFQATGDKEEYLKQKTEQLKSMLDAEASQAAAAEKALKAMTDNGVDKSSKAFQDMIRQLATAKTNMIDTQAKIDSLGKEAEESGTQAQGLNKDLQNIGKDVAWGNVTSGLKEITDKLESGARAAINFGKRIIQSAKGSTGLADEIKTTVDQFSDMGLTADSYQRMSKVAEFVDTPVEAILNARQRMSKALAGDKGKKSLEEVLGIKLQGQSPEDLFWETGEALMHMGEAFDKEAAAQTLFGRGWRELAPLFKTGREEYEKMLSEQNVLTDDQVEKLGQADDAIKKVEQEIETLKAQFWAENADTIVEVMQWLVDNKDGVVTAVAAIAGAFGLLKMGEFAANLTKVVESFKTLGFAGGAGGLGGGGAAGGLGIGGGGLLGLLGLAGIVAGFAAAADKRNNHPETVRGTEQYLEAQGAGAEGALADYILANKAMEELLPDDAEEKWEATAAWLAKAQETLNNTEGGAAALDAYDDWRDEHGYGRKDWELPEHLAQAVEQLTGGTEAQKQSNSEMAAAAQGLQGLPADIANAIAQSMAGIGITIDGQMLIGYVNSALGNMVNP